MLYLLLAITSSALVSIIMRLSTDRVTRNIGMLSVNYLTCLLTAAVYTGADAFTPASSDLPATIAMGIVHGALYLFSFVLLQINVQKNGVVLSATFMKLGLLVPMAVSVLFFREQPHLLQILGFAMAITASVLINYEKESRAARSRAGLLLLLLSGGCADVMAKIFEELGSSAMSDRFLLYTFAAALVLCLALMAHKRQHPGAAEFFWGVMIGVPNFFSAKFLLRSLESVSAVIAYPTYSAGTLLVITLSGVLLFRERLGRRQWIALGIILAALCLLNM